MAAVSRWPKHPAQIRPRAWRAVFRRTFDESLDDNLGDWAAALTYYAVLSLFPMLIVLVALLGLIGQASTVDTLIASLGRAGLNGIANSVDGPLHGVVRNKGGAGALVGFGLLGSLWSASIYIGAFMRASNAIYEVQEGRPFWKRKPMQVAITLVMVLLCALVAVALVLTGSLAQAVGDAIGVGRGAVHAWEVAKWPVMLIIVMTVFALLYYVAPNVRQPKFRWVTPGGMLAVLIWVAASAAFGVYVANYGSYNKTYGALASVITFLVWLWLTNLALLIGAEFDSELERQRELEAGLPAQDEIQLPPREAAE
ncbi:MAG: YihY/virulence factor BrkB family protein [Actinobacteria bacterium]|nr:YihY/virulence factor BrkB family protein [Actinomycetota bacterium]